MTKVESGSFVHVVATIDKAARRGTIRYVNPTTSDLRSEAAPDPNVELVVRNADGGEIDRRVVPIRYPSRDPDNPRSIGLIQASLPKLPGMRSVALLLEGVELDRYVAGAAEPARGSAALGLGPATPSPNKKTLSIQELADAAAIPGVSYTLQVLPDNGERWTTIAVGRPKPEFLLDGNQFPGAKVATVRIVRTTGFDDEVLIEEKVAIPLEPVLASAMPTRDALDHVDLTEVDAARPTLKPKRG